MEIGFNKEEKRQRLIRKKGGEEKGPSGSENARESRAMIKLERSGKDRDSWLWGQERSNKPSPGLKGRPTIGRSKNRDNPS